MSKKETIYKDDSILDLVKEIGPFEQARNNLQKFAWNAMISHATSVAIKSLEEVEGLDTKQAQITRVTAELTLQTIAQLILERDGGHWN